MDDPVNIPLEKWLLGFSFIPKSTVHHLSKIQLRMLKQQTPYDTFTLLPELSLQIIEPPNSDVFRLAMYGDVQDLQIWLNDRVK
jgi:hypothetical protein